MSNFVSILVWGAVAILGGLLIALLVVLPVYFLYPIVVNSVFPGLVFSGAIASKISIWEALALSIFCSILFQTSVKTNTNKKLWKSF